MAGAGETQPNPPQSLAEVAVRTLRHEVGDLLQTVYATAALLQQRLPAGWDLERRILTDMRARGEACRGLLDLTHDLICPISLTREPVDWAELLAPLAAAAALGRPTVRIESRWDAVPPIHADAQRLEQLGRVILADACESAMLEVSTALSATPDGKQVKWTVLRDGDTVAAEQLDGYFRLRSTSVQGPSSIGMALAKRIVLLHGGQILADNRPEGGLFITVCLPAIAKNRN